MADIKPEDVTRMNEIEGLVARTIGQFRENTEAAIVAGALLRIVYFLYMKYPEAVRRQLVEGAVAFLQQTIGRDVAGEVARHERLPFILSALRPGDPRKPS